MNYIFHILILFEIYLIVAMSLNLLVGYAGLIQIAHAAYFGVGAYTAALLWTKYGFGTIAGLLVAGLVSALISLLISLPALRFRGDNFVMIGLAAQVFLYSLMLNWVELTGGPYGISGIPRPSISSGKIATQGGVFAIYAAVVGVMGIL